MGTSRNGRCEGVGRAGAAQRCPTSMGTSRNGRCEHAYNRLKYHANGELQWGPPGMGGVSRSARHRLDGGIATSMGTSRNGRCEAWPPFPGPSGRRNFNGDLPEWEV